MENSHLVNNNLLSKSVTISFQIEGEYGKIYKFTKTLSNITKNASNEDIYNAAAAIAMLYEHDKFDVKLTTTNLIENEILEILEEDL